MGEKNLALLELSIQSGVEDVTDNNKYWKWLVINLESDCMLEDDSAMGKWSRADKGLQRAVGNVSRWTEGAGCIICTAPWESDFWGTYPGEYLKNKALWKGIWCVCRIPEFSTNLESDAWLVESADAKGGHWGLTVTEGCLYSLFYCHYIKDLEHPGIFGIHSWNNTSQTLRDNCIQCQCPKGSFLGTFETSN